MALLTLVGTCGGQLVEWMCTWSDYGYRLFDLPICMWLDGAELLREASTEILAFVGTSVFIFI